MALVRRRGALTPFLVLLFALVLSRWLEVRLGWGEFVALPLAALAGVAVLEATAPAGARRLTPVGWGLNLVAGLALAGLIYIVAG